MSSLSLLFVQFRHSNWHPAARGNPRQTSGRREGDDDVSIGAPASARPTGARIAQGDRSTARDRNLLEFSVSEESDPLTIRRKERLVCVVSAREQRGLSLVKGPQSEPPGGVRSARDEGQPPAVRRIGDPVA